MNSMPAMASMPNASFADAQLNALPHPIIVVTPEGNIADANVAAEQFFAASIPVLRRHMFRDLVPFGSPLLALIEQVRERGAAVNEYKVDLSTPRNPRERLVDLYVAPLGENGDREVSPQAFGEERREGGDQLGRGGEALVQRPICVELVR